MIFFRHRKRHVNEDAMVTLVEAIVAIKGCTVEYSGALYDLHCAWFDHPDGLIQLCGDQTDIDICLNSTKHVSAEFSNALDAFIVAGRSLVAEWDRDPRINGKLNRDAIHDTLTMSLDEWLTRFAQITNPYGTTHAP